MWMSLIKQIRQICENDMNVSSLPSNASHSSNRVLSKHYSETAYQIAVFFWAYLFSENWTEIKYIGLDYCVYYTLTIENS